jgi:hypothetical protein
MALNEASAVVLKFFSIPPHNRYQPYAERLHQGTQDRIYNAMFWEYSLPEIIAWYRKIFF